MNVYEACEYQDTSLCWLCHIAQKKLKSSLIKQHILHAWQVADTVVRNTIPLSQEVKDGSYQALRYT